MESVIPSNLDVSHQHLPLFRYFNSYSKFKPFIQKSRRNQQRVIPLTREIRRDMMDFNVSQSNSNVSKKLLNNSFSITSLVKDEVENILQDLSTCKRYIQKEEIYDIIEKCFREKMTIIQENNNNAIHLDQSDFDINQEYEVTAEEIFDDRDKNKLIVDNIKILEQRIISLEGRINYMIQYISKLGRIQAKQFKNNTSLLIEEIRRTKYKNETENNIDTLNQQKEMALNTQNQKLDIKNDITNKYDDIYYTRRENILNLLNYKKSLETLELNQKIKLNPYVKPLSIDLPKTNENFKQKPMFLPSNDM